MSDVAQITQGCPCTCCPRYEELNAWADHLEEIATRLDRDAWFYLEVKADIVENGWESEYARVGISGYRDPTVPNQNAAALIQHFEGMSAEEIFAEDLTPVMLDNSVARPGLARVMRERASNARTLAKRGLDYCKSNALYAGKGADSVLDYFCTLDPDKIDQDVWDTLFKIGWIDFATWDDASYRVASEKWARAELYASVATLIFAWRGGLVSLAKSTAKGLVRLTKKQAKRLAELTKKRPPTRVSKATSLERNHYSVDEEAGLMHGFMGVGHAQPWGQMSAIARKKFQHSYSRHAHEFGLPAWSAKNAEALQAQFNAAVGQVRANADKVLLMRKPYDSMSVRVRYFEATLNGKRYYYYELWDIGKFVSAGLAR
ncbi:hypothetical protein [Thioclava sp. GXIMD4216]|uniref:hypothetical protein n=1 Tax=unclassified Thioclava TaxID=2621713 RepID=UPI0030D12B10